MKIRVDARPAPIELDPTHTAVVVVDMQHDFASKGGMFDLAGIDISAIQAIVEPTTRVLDAARAAGLLVVYLKMAFAPDYADAGFPDSPIWIKHLRMRAGDTVTAPDGRESRILIRDCWNTDIIDELAPRDDDIVLYKARYSGFYGTELETVLRAHDIDAIVVVGATTSVCVESTVRDATFRDLHCLVLDDCTAEPIGADTPRSNHEASLLVLQLLFAWVAPSEALLDALAGAHV